MNINGVALVFPEPRKTELREFTITSVESDEAIVRVEFSGVSIGTERGLFHGDDKRAVFPAVAGYQCVGVVAHLQKPTSRVKIGERVLVGPLGRVPGFNKCWGAHTSHTIAKISDLIHCPLEVSPETAALSWLAGVGLQGVRKAGVKKGDSTVIIGQGMIGQMLAQMCRVAGASRIIASDMIPVRVETSRRYSCDLCIDATKGSVREIIMSETGGGADVVFEATGRADMLSSCLEYVKLDGMICNTGLYPGNVSFPFKTAHEKQIRMVFPFGWGDAEGDASVFADTLRLIGEGRVTIQPLITHHIAYKDAPQEYLKIVSEGSSDAIGVIINWKDQ
jgi:2-desacetyl-2-hydroxyethyl bacteriochlorophyllide A dehydrogenase